MPFLCRFAIRNIFFRWSFAPFQQHISYFRSCVLKSRRGIQSKKWSLYSKRKRSVHVSFPCTVSFGRSNHKDSVYGGSDGEYATGSNAAALNLAAGDTVFLKSRTSTHAYYAEPDQIYCTFSGYKLKLAEDLIIGN